MNKTELRIHVSQILNNMDNKAESQLLREIIFGNDIDWDKALEEARKIMPELNKEINGGI